MAQISPRMSSILASEALRASKWHTAAKLEKGAREKPGLRYQFKQKTPLKAPYCIDNRLPAFLLNFSVSVTPSTPALHMLAETADNPLFRR
jgi:hypothetical protein